MALQKMAARAALATGIAMTSLGIAATVGGAGVGSSEIGRAHV